MQRRRLTLYYTIENETQAVHRLDEKSDARAELTQYIRQRPPAQVLTGQANGGLRILDVVNVSGMRQHGDEYYGSHPIHGSKNGTNFHVNPKKNVWHCFRDDSGGDGFYWLAVEAGLIDCSDAQLHGLSKELFQETLQIARKRGLIPKPSLKPLEDNGHGLSTLVETPTLTEHTTPDQVAESILCIHRILTIAGSGRAGADEIFLYADGVYLPGGEAIIARTTEDNFDKAGLDHVSNIHYVHEVLGHVRRRTYVPRNVFDSDPFVLNLKNGLLDLRTYELKPHTPDYPSLSQLPVTYDPRANCPRFQQFLDEVLYKGDDVPLQEFVGAMLWAEPLQKVILLDGTGSNGKGTFIGIIKAILGEANICARSLQDLEFNRFATADLFGKRANLYADLPDIALKSTGRFKILTGGEPVTAEKKFGQPFTFVPYAKHMYSANKIPETFEDSTAFWRRWILITFPNQFLDRRDNKSLLRELTTPQELSGILNWAIAGLYRLQGHEFQFSYSKSIEVVRTEYIRKSSPIKAFLMDACIIDAAANVVKQDLYSALVEYCKAHQLPIITRQTFFNNLPMHVKVESAQLEKEGKRKHCFMGIGLKPRDQWERKEEEEKEFVGQQPGRCAACGKEGLLGPDRSGGFLVCSNCFGVGP